MKLAEQLYPLRKALTQHFNRGELKTLCFDLNIDYDELAGETKTEKVTALLDYCERHSRLPFLLAYLQQERPKIDWVKYDVDETKIVKSPFKGLQHFDKADAELFFGREDLTIELARRLRRENFLAVIGASGCGKSSLIRAGMIPSLASGSPFIGTEQWPILLITPGVHPLKNLATSLTANTISTSATTTLINDLKRDPRTLDLIAAKLLVQRGQGDKLLLIIDQFEELFTLCTDEAERQAFIDNLMTAVKPETGGPTIVLIALRADFYDQCDSYPQLLEAMETHRKYIGSMNQEEMRRAIEQPALRHGYTFEPGLVDLILADMQADNTRPLNPGTLPLLSHTLKETWRNRDGSTLTLQGYTATGQVQGAIAKTAEDEFAQLLPKEQELARRIFLLLIDLNERTDPTRRQAKREDLLPSSPDTALADDILTNLIDARLLTVDQNEQEVETINIIHEALISRWPRLQEWLSINQDVIILRHRLTDATRDWEQNGQDTSYLYQGKRLKIIEEMIPLTELSTREKAFVTASQEIERLHRRHQNGLLAGVVLLLAFISIAAAAVWSSQQSPWHNLYDTNPVFSLTMSSSEPPHYYLGTRDLGIGLSENGSDWDVSMNGLPFGSSGKFARAVTRLTVDRQNPNHVLAAVADSGIYESFDGASTWQDVSGEAENSLPPKIEIKDLIVWDNWFLVVTETNATTDLYVSQDGGQHWKLAQELACTGATGESIEPEGVTTVYISSDGSTIYVGAAGGLYGTQRLPCWSWQHVANIPPVFLIASNQTEPEILYLETTDPDAAANSRIYRWSAVEDVWLLTTIEQNEPLALAPHPNPTESTAVYVLLANGEVAAVTKEGNIRTIDQVSGFVFDLLAVSAPNNDAVQLWLAHMDGLLVLEDKSPSAQ